MENVAVHVHSHRSGQVCASYDADGARFHIWLGLSSAPDGRYYAKQIGPLFKNPPIGVERCDPGYYRTRKLDPNSKGNARKIALLMKIVRDNNLVENAMIASVEKMKREAVVAEAAEVQRYRNALFDASKATDFSDRLDLEIGRMTDAQVLALGRFIRNR